MKKLLLWIVAASLLMTPAGIAALEGPELYPGEKELYEKASAEGMVVSFDTGPTWANWGVMFKRFKERCRTPARHSATRAMAHSPKGIRSVMDSKAG